jgi:hypothetical protein
MLRVQFVLQFMIASTAGRKEGGDGYYGERPDGFHER